MNLKSSDISQEREVLGLSFTSPKTFSKEERMNKTATFTLGAVLGAIGGSIGTYFIVKEMFAQQASEEIERYAEHCEERIERFRLEYVGANIDDVEDTSEEKLTDDPDEEVINKNEGVKKYHHRPDSISSYGTNNIFERIQSEKDRSEIKKQIKDSKLISDIDEDEWMNEENGYDKQTLDIFLGDDKDIFGIWGYQTDNEDDADRKFGKPTQELIGSAHTYEELLSYCEESEDGIGVTYVRNDELKIDFELVIHDAREDDK